MTNIKIVHKEKENKNIKIPVEVSVTSETEHLTGTLGSKFLEFKLWEVLEVEKGNEGEDKEKLRPKSCFLDREVPVEGDKVRGRRLGRTEKWELWKPIAISMAHSLSELCESEEQREDLANEVLIWAPTSKK